MADESSIAERIQEQRDEVDALAGNAEAKRVLADALRGVLDEISASGASPEELTQFAAALRDGADVLRRSSLRKPEAGAGGYTGMENFHDRSPVVGLANPIAPPAFFEHFPAEKCLRGRVEFGHIFEGGPGLVHGGFLAALLDEALGVATVHSGSAGMTGEYTVRYHRPTRINVPLTFEARFDSLEGRKIYVSADLFDGDEKTVSARGTFIAVDAEKFEAFFEERKGRIGG